MTEATGAVVAVAKSSSVTTESKLPSLSGRVGLSFNFIFPDADLDFSGLSAHQTKTLEMNIQVKLLELESQVETERSKLSQLRRQHYKTGSDGVDN